MVRTSNKALSAGWVGSLALWVEAGGTPGHAVSSVATIPQGRAPVSLEALLQGPSANDESHPWPSRKSDPGHQGTPAQELRLPFSHSHPLRGRCTQTWTELCTECTSMYSLSGESKACRALPSVKEIMDTVGAGRCGSRGVEVSPTPGMYLMVLFWL